MPLQFPVSARRVGIQVGEEGHRKAGDAFSFPPLNHFSIYIPKETPKPPKLRKGKFSEIIESH